MLGRTGIRYGRHIRLNAQQRRCNSSHSHEPIEPKTLEISMTKVFGVAALVAMAIVYKNNKNADRPLVETRLYREEASGDRKLLRNENFLDRYKISFMKGFIRDKGGIGQRQFRKHPDLSPVPTVLINTHSPFGPQFGAGIKTDTLGPRRERVRIFAPLP